MSILKRFTDIMSANINSLLDKCEDPAKMVDQILRNLNDDLGKVKAETASIMAEETRAKRELAECNQEINKLVEYAKRAVKSGNDDDARFFLSKKADLTKNQETLEQKVQIASTNALKMRQMHDKLIKEINDLNARRDDIKAKVATANMQKRLNDLGGSLHHSTANLGAFARMEEKANRMLDEANAMAELNTPKDNLQSLMDKYDAQPSSSIEDELAALKNESSSIDDELLALKSATYEE
ncbi:MAG: PspA/IM30 family protein [Turicibacter sp.]|nr:PspA/IM30 family protein [Turicibacter sp.]MBQ1786931.1 PspA/IM30 family protein [Turicibacter sp.]